MDRLIKGYRAFRNGRYLAERANYAELAKGQAPQYLIIACSDSRVDPAAIFSANPGELFVLRNVANIVPPYEEGGGLHGTSAVISYAVNVLKVRHVVVLGHASCGGVAAALNPPSVDNVPFLSDWIHLLDPAKQRMHAHENPQTDLERECVKLSLERLMTFPFIAERVKAGDLKLVGGRFGIEQGVLELLNEKTGAFEPVSDT